MQKSFKAIIRKLIAQIPPAVRQRVTAGLSGEMTGPARQGPRVYPIDRTAGRLYFQNLRIEQSGLVKLTARIERGFSQEPSLPECLIDETEVPLLQSFRTVGPDTPLGQPPADPGSLFRGMIFVYRVPGQLPSRTANLTLVFKGETVVRRRVPLQAAPVHYESLLTEGQVLHRDRVYGSGPPSGVVSKEIAALAGTLKGPVLDFGCGSGALVKQLREMGTPALGIELDREIISSSLDPSVRGFVTLYDGNPPLPYADGQFRSVVAVEVLEHIPSFEPMIGELSRITNDLCVVTVPDISSVPMCFPQNVVPWHLLEGTHVNFFTPDSLRGLMQRYFSTVLVGKICPTQTNDTLWHESLLALCKKK